MVEIVVANAVIIQGIDLETLSPSFLNGTNISGKTKSNWRRIAIYQRWINGEFMCLAK